jgi:hypothetical protein
MSVLDTVMDKLFFWRRDDESTHPIEGCFTLPGAELGSANDNAEACSDEPDAVGVPDATDEEG